MKNKSKMQVLLVSFVVCLLLAACARTEVGTTTGYGQSVPAGGGMVQSFIKVELEDGSEVTAWLPQDQEVWDTFMTGARRGIRVEIKRDGDFWKFVRILPKE